MEVEVKTEEEHWHCCIVLMGSLILIPPSRSSGCCFPHPLANPKVLPAAERDSGSREREGTIDGRIIGNESAVATAI